MRNVILEKDNVNVQILFEMQRVKKKIEKWKFANKRKLRIKLFEL